VLQYTTIVRLWFKCSHCTIFRL